MRAGGWLYWANTLRLSVVDIHGMEGKRYRSAQQPWPLGRKWIFNAATGIPGKKEYLCYDYDINTILVGHRSRAAIRDRALFLLKSLMLHRKTQEQVYWKIATLTVCDDMDMLMLLFTETLDFAGGPRFWLLYLKRGITDVL
jgi:hypothetical protein